MTEATGSEAGIRQAGISEAPGIPFSLTLAGGSALSATAASS